MFNQADNVDRKKLTYKKKVLVLLVIILFLSLLYGGTVYFDSQYSAQRKSSYTWLDQRFLSYADRIEVIGSQGMVVLTRRNNVWVIVEGTAEYPVKQAFIEDMLTALTRRGNFPVRSNSLATASRYGISENSSRIIVRGGAGLPLLDLFIGYTDLTGGEIFLRKAGQNEIRSGEDRFTLYTENNRTFWYDLRLFPLIEPVMVQRIRLSFLIDEDKPLVISRSRNGWIFENSNVPFPGGDYWLRSILDARGEDFARHTGWDPAESIVLELGDGSYRVIFLGPQAADGSRQAMVSDSSLVFILSEWTFRQFYSGL